MDIQEMILKRPSTNYIIYLLALSIWVGSIFAAPILSSSQQTRFLGQGIYEVFSWVCHQKTERSFYMQDNPLAVCSRCTFIYFGILGGSLVFMLRPIATPRKTYLFVAAFPLIIDGLTQLVGIRESNNSLRAITGFIFGTAIAFYLAPQAESAVEEMLRRTLRAIRRPARLIRES